MTPFLELCFASPLPIPPRKGEGTFPFSLQADLLNVFVLKKGIMDKIVAGLGLGEACVNHFGASFLLQSSMDFDLVFPMSERAVA